MPIDFVEGMPNTPPMNPGKKKTTPEEAIRVIAALGGTNAVARLCNIKPPSVSGWKRNGIPEAHMRFFRLLRPEVFYVEKKKR